MAVYAAVTQVISGDRVTAVAVRPFAVIEGENYNQLIFLLAAEIDRLEALEAEIEAARYDERHEHHHWWVR